MHPSVDSVTEIVKVFLSDKKLFEDEFELDYYDYYDDRKRIWVVICRAKKQPWWKIKVTIINTCVLVKKKSALITWIKTLDKKKENPFVYIYAWGSVESYNDFEIILCTFSNSFSNALIFYSFFLLFFYYSLQTL